MDDKDFLGSPEPYEAVMKRSSTKIDLEAKAVLSRGYGGMVNLFAEQEDVAEERHLLDLLAEKLAIERGDIAEVDVEKVVNALELGIERYKLAIPERDFETQDLSENVFQYIYKYFGEDNKGWRMGRAAILDNLKDLLEKQKTSLAGSPFEDFLRTLDLDLGKDPDKKKLIVLYYPRLDRDIPIKSGEDAQLTNLSEADADRVKKYLRIYSLISQVYPGRFMSDNPQGNVVVNVMDSSYKWFAARNPDFLNAYDKMSDKVETPGAYNRDLKILNSLNF